MKKSKTLLSTAIMAMALSGVQSTYADNLPLMELPDSDERDYWLPEEVNVPGTVEMLQEVVGSDAVPLAVEQDGPVRIALVYPSADVSDFWARAYLAFTKRMDQLGIAYETTEFASRQIEHSLQSTYTEQLLQDGDLYDFVIFGPSELATPLNICNYMAERLGNDVTYALVRGIPGITDNQRSGDFKKCIEEKANWKMAYEHYGNYTREGGYDGTNLILQAYPEVTVIHNANTAMSMGSMEALIGAERDGDIFSTGWGGTGLELEAIRAKTLNATPMRMGDDVGAAAAEALKFHLEGREDELPLVFLGRILVAHDEMPAEELDALETEAFRFSGVGALER